MFLFIASIILVETSTVMQSNSRAYKCFVMLRLEENISMYQKVCFGDSLLN